MENFWTSELLKDTIETSTRILVSQSRSFSFPRRAFGQNKKDRRIISPHFTRREWSSFLCLHGFVHIRTIVCNVWSTVWAVLRSVGSQLLLSRPSLYPSLSFSEKWVKDPQTLLPLRLYVLLFRIASMWDLSAGGSQMVRSARMTSCTSMSSLFFPMIEAHGLKTSLICRAGYFCHYWYPVTQQLGEVRSFIWYLNNTCYSFNRWKGLFEWPNILYFWAIRKRKALLLGVSYYFSRSVNF